MSWTWKEIKIQPWGEVYLCNKLSTPEIKSFDLEIKITVNYTVKFPILFAS